MVKNRCNDRERERNEFPAFGNKERDAMIQDGRKQHFETLTKQCPMWSAKRDVDAYVMHRTLDDVDL